MKGMVWDFYSALNYVLNKEVGTEEEIFPRTSDYLKVDTYYKVIAWFTMWL